MSLCWGCYQTRSICPSCVSNASRKAARSFVRDTSRPRPGVPSHLLTDDAAELVGRGDIDVVVELVGGIEPEGIEKLGGRVEADGLERRREALIPAGAGVVHDGPGAAVARRACRVASVSSTTRSREPVT